MQCYIKENSFVVKLAAKKLGSNRVAIVFGKTIYLHNATSVEILQNTAWLRHEVAHIKQFQQYGFTKFIIKYLWESLQHGYYHNKYEVAARAAETDATICDNIFFDKK